MQKKILASLLVAPLAFNAMADITVADGLQGADGWTQSGISGTSIFTDNGVRCPIAGGFINRTLNLQPGKYTLTFTNAVGVKVSLTNAEDIVENGGVYTFTVAGNAAKSLELKIESAENNGFQFDKLSLVLNFDFDAAATALTAKLPALTTLDDEKSTLAAEYKALAEEKAAIEALIATLTGDKQEDAYAAQQMWNYPESDAITLKINALVEKAEAYNEKAAADNEAYYIKTTNAQNLAWCESEVERLKGELAKINAAIDAAQEGKTADVNKYVDGKQAEKTAEMEAVIALCDANFKKAFEGAAEIVDMTALKEEYNKWKQPLSEYDENILHSGNPMYKTWIADAEAYYKLLAETDLVKTEYDKALSQLFALKGIEGYETAFAGVNTGWQTQLLDEKNKADEAIATATANEVIEGCAAKAPAAQATIDAAKAAMTQIVSDAQELVEAQNGLMTEALETLATLEVPAEVPESIKAEVAEVAAHIASLKKDVEDAYSLLQLPVDGFAATVQEIQKQLAAVQPILDLQKAYDDLAKYITDNVTGNIEGAFKGTMDSIEKSLGELNLESPQDFKDEIKENIDLTKDNAEKLVAARDAAKAELDARNEAIENMGAEAAKVKFLEGAVKPTLGEVDDKYYVTPKADYDAVKGADAQKAYEDLTKLAKALTDSNDEFAGSVADVLATYATAAEVANKAVVTAKYTAVEKAAEGEYFGDDVVAGKLAAIKTALDAISTDVAASEEDIPAAANAIYDELNKVLGDLTSLDSDITNYKSNQTWATAQNTLLDGILKEIKDAEETNATTSWDPALSFFADKLAGFTTEANDLIDAVDEALRNGIADGNVTDEDRKAIEDKINALQTNVKKTDTQITENQGAYVGLLQDAESTRDHIQKVIDYLNGLIEEGGNPDETATDAWFEGLTDLMDELTKVNQDLGEAYGNGVAGDKNGTFSGNYQDLRDGADQIRTEIDEKYGNLVAIANNEWIEKWNEKYQALRGEYTNSIETFNFYGSANIDNTKYYNYLKDNVVVNVGGEDKKVLGDHEPIYKYSALITELDKKVRDYITDQNKAKVVITQEMFDQQTANSYIPDMEKLVADMKAAAEQVAKTYYNIIIDEAQATVDAAKTEMANAGVSADLVDEYTIEAQDRIKMQAKFLASSEDVVIAVNHIANDLDLINIDVDAAAKAEWTRAYGDDSKELGIMAGEIAGFKYVASDELVEVFNDAKAAVEAMTSPAGLDDLKAALSGLNEQMEAARNAYNALKTKNQAAADAIATTENLMEQVAKLREDNKALQEVADGLAATPDNGDIEGDIDNIEDAIETSTDILKDEPKIQGDIDAVQGDIDNGYASLVANENALLNGLMSKIRIAYNNARAADKFESVDAANAENKAIDELQKAVDDLYNANKDEITDTYKSDALALEEALTNKLINLQSLMGTDTDLTGVLTDLNELYNTTYTAVETGKAAVGELVKDEYEPKYQDLLDTLEEIHAAMDAEGNQLILHKDKYESQINAVADELAALNADATAAQQAAAEKAAIEAATAANYEALTAELDALKAALEAAKEQVTAWDVAEWNVYLNGLDSRVANIGDTLEAEKAITDKNPDGITDAEKAELSEAIASVQTEMDYYVLMAANAYAENANNATKAAISDARKALVDAVSVVNSAEISKKISDQAIALETLYNETAEALEEAADDTARIAAYEKFVEGAKAIQEAIEAIRQEIVENTYVVGDVNGSAGEPDVADLQLLFTWIGEDLTLEQIKEEHGAAIAAAADVNGTGDLNIADATALIQIISNEPSTGSRRIMARRGVVESDNYFGLVRSGEEEGNRLYSLFLNNTASFIGAQVDIQLPVGMTLLDAQVANRAENHQVQIFDNGNGNYRLVIFSMNNAAFEGNSGELVQLTIEGIGNPLATGMILADPTHAAVQAKMADTSMLDSIMESAHNVKERIYNAAGQSLRAVQRGINIIRRSDGTTSKEMHK